MSSIKTVAVIGATGNLGPAIVAALISANFTVTALTRPTSNHTFPSGVRVHKTDFTSSESLAEAFKGQDAVVSAIATAALGEQIKIIDAAIKAGVKSFIPSEFGIDTRNLEGGIGKILALKTQTREYLEKVAGERDGFTWTGVATSLFFDWGLKFGSIGFSLPTKTANIFDSGNEPFYGSNLSTIGEGIAAILSPSHLAFTANKYLIISSLTTTQNEILKVLEEETGEKWTVNKVSTDESKRIAEEKLAKGDRSAFGDYLKVHLFRDGEGAARKGNTANKELGLKEVDLTETVRRVLKE